MVTKPKQPVDLRAVAKSPASIASAKMHHARRVARAAADITFEILWNKTRRSWDINRDGNPTGGFAYDRNTAIGLAKKAAGFEAIEGLKAIVTSVQDGKTKIEWSS